jgi:hypothetical protein
VKTTRSPFFLASLLATAIVASSIPAMAAHHPVFGSIAPEVRRQLPAGLKFRFPASLPSDSLHPYIYQSDGKFFVNLSSSSGCNSIQSCKTVGGIGVARGSVSQSRGSNTVSLANGITGYYMSDPGKTHSIQWEQDEQRYIVILNARVYGRQAAVDLAKSTSRERPIGG